MRVRVELEHLVHPVLFMVEADWSFFLVVLEADWDLSGKQVQVVESLKFWLLEILLLHKAFHFP